MGAAYQIVFVCMGNICRSPTAEIVMQRLLDEEGLDEWVRLASAGTGGWHVGEGIDPRSGEALAAAGYDPTRHRAQQFAADWFSHYDLVVAMDRKNRWLLQEMAPTPADRDKVRMLRSYDPEAAKRGDLDVPDPYYDGGFEKVLRMVEAGCRGLLAEIKPQLAV